MKLATSYEIVKSRYPAMVEECIKQARAKKVDSDPSGWEWLFEWCVVIEGDHSFAGMLAAAAEPEPKLAIEERLADYARRCRVSITAKPAPRRNYSSRFPSGEVPKEIIGQQRKVLESRDAEEARCAALTPEESQKEVDDLLRQLRRGKGFMEIRL